MIIIVSFYAGCRSHGWEGIGSMEGDWKKLLLQGKVGRSWDGTGLATCPRAFMGEIDLLERGVSESSVTS